MTYVAFFFDPRFHARQSQEKKRKRKRKRKKPAGTQPPGQRSSAALLNGALAATTPIVNLPPGAYRPIAISRGMVGGRGDRQATLHRTIRLLGSATGRVDAQPLVEWMLGDYEASICRGPKKTFVVPAPSGATLVGIRENCE